MSPFTLGEGGATSAQNGIGTRLRTARDRLGWSRETLAFHSGLSWSAIAQVESGRRTNVRPGTLHSLSRALGVTIDYLVAGAGAPPMLTHHVLIYGTEQEFADAAVPFLAGAVEHSEAALAVTSDANITLLQRQLGRAARGIEFVPSSRWYHTPARAIEDYRRFVAERIAKGRPWVRIVGELSKGDLTERELRSWSSYEALLNLVLGSQPVTLMCPYDTRVLGEEAVRLARLTHSHAIGADGPVPCPEFADPSGFVLEP